MLRLDGIASAESADLRLCRVHRHQPPALRIGSARVKQSSTSGVASSRWVELPYENLGAEVLTGRQRSIPCSPTNTREAGFDEDHFSLIGRFGWESASHLRRRDGSFLIQSRHTTDGCPVGTDGRAWPEADRLLASGLARNWTLFLCRRLPAPRVCGCRAWDFGRPGPCGLPLDGSQVGFRLDNLL